MILAKEREGEMSHKARFFSAAFLAGALAGGAATLLLVPHSAKSASVNGRHAHSAESDGLENWSGQVTALRKSSDQALPVAPMGWY
jgi:gas vesicle protein